LSKALKELLFDGIFDLGGAQCLSLPVALALFHLLVYTYEFRSNLMERERMHARGRECQWAPARRVKGSPQKGAPKEQASARHPHAGFPLSLDTVPEP